MLITDFSGTYDYEKTEAEHAATVLNEDFTEGYYETRTEYDAACAKELAHWGMVYKNDIGAFEDFKRHFEAALI